MLTDLFGRPLQDLRISVTDRCNFRCTYCMPAEVFGMRYQFLPKPQLLTFEELTRLAHIFVGLGVRKLRITGGEPLLRQDIEKLIAMLASVEGVEDISLTTNGYLLAQKAQGLKEAGLHRVSVSLDALDDETFGEINGRGFGVRRVLEGMAAAVEAGLRPIKVNMVVQRGVNDDAILEMARFFREQGHILRFIEFMDVGTLNAWNTERVVPAAEVIQRISAEAPLEPVERDYRGEVAERYRYQDGSGEVGVIASVTQPFCGDCTRARLSPEGMLMTCLFASDGVDLKTPLRSGATDEEVRDILTRVWERRGDRYSELRTQMTEGERRARKVEMYHIGG